MKRIVFILCVCLIMFTGCQKVENNGERVTEPKKNEESVSKTDDKSQTLKTDEVTPSADNVGTPDNVQSSETNDQKVSSLASSGDSTDINGETRATTVAKGTDVALKATEIPVANDKGIYTLKFKNTTSSETINSLNGKEVSITGYISTLSPLDGKFAYLMNMPYQSCPFCVPGTSQISNTLAIFAGNKSKIEFTDQPVTVVGTLETGTFTDDFGYQYSVRLNNVTVKKADIDKLSDAIKKYSILAENNVVNNIYGCIMMADYTIYYDYYELEKPYIISIPEIDKVKNDLEQYNSKGDYKVLADMLAELKAVCTEANSFIEKEEFDKVKGLQEKLDKSFYTFSSWISAGEL